MKYVSPFGAVVVLVVAAVRGVWRLVTGTRP